MPGMLKSGGGRVKAAGSKRGIQARDVKPLKKGRRGAKQDADEGLYEADEIDADEERNASRYDNVESYEYVQPDTFEDDEEIDEEMAFSAEDKIKYAGWFDEDDGSDDGLDEEEGEEGEAEDDMDLLESDEDPEVRMTVGPC